MPVPPNVWACYRTARRTCVKRADAWQQLDPAVVLALDMAQVDDREGGVRTTHDRLHHLAVNTGRASGVGVNRAILPLQSSHVRARRWASTGAAGTRAGGVLYLSRHAAGGEGGVWVGGKGWGCRERVSGCDRSMGKKGTEGCPESKKIFEVLKKVHFVIEVICMYFVSRPAGGRPLTRLAGMFSATILQMSVPRVRSEAPDNVQRLGRRQAPKMNHQTTRTVIRTEGSRPVRL